MISGVAILDAIAVLAWLSAIVGVYVRWRSALEDCLRPVFLGLCSFAALYGACMFVEWSGLSTQLEYIEDLAGATLPMWWLLVAFRIEHRVHAETMERHLQEQREIFNQSFQLMEVLSTDGKVLLANDAALEFVGDTTSRNIGKYFWEADWWSHSSELRETVRDAVKRTAAGEVVCFEATHKDANDRIHAMDFSMRPMSNPNGAIRAIITEAHDITELKETLEALRESERRLRESQRMAHLGQWWWDIKTGEVEWSDEVYSIFQLDRADFTPHIDSILALSPWPEDHARDQELIQRAIESHNQGSYEQRFQRPDGSLGHYTSTFQGIYNAAGELVAMKGTVQDITERKQAEDAAREAQMRLLEQQQSETERVQAELEKARSRLVIQTRLATIGQVAGSIAHELRNPLGAVRNAAYFLKRYVVEKEPDALEYLGIIEEEVDVSNRIITDLMSVVRSQKPTKCQVKVCDLIKEVLGRVKPPPELKCEVAITDTEFTLAGDPGQLRQALMNLVMNAIQAMDGKGLVRIRAARSSEAVDIIVEDAGPGVSSENQAQVFEPLFTTKAKGAGLGLTICREIVERHDGTLELIESDLGGAAFRIRLPNESPEPERESANVGPSEKD